MLNLSLSNHVFNDAIFTFKMATADGFRWYSVNTKTSIIVNGSKLKAMEIENKKM